MNRFYAPDCKQQELYSLNEEESKHVSRVLRLKEGDAVELVDGKGSLFPGHLLMSTPKACRIQMGQQQFFARPRPYYLHVVIAPTKSIERLEWFLEKAVEIGIDEISLLRCRYSERKEVNELRLHKVLVAAMKQSLGYWLPILNGMRPIETWISHSQTGICMIAHCISGEHKKGLKELVTGQSASVKNLELSPFLQGSESVPYSHADLHHEAMPQFLAMIGPEGDFSRDELALAKEHGFLALDLGPNRLRTETAAVVVCAELSVLLR